MTLTFYFFPGDIFHINYLDDSIFIRTFLRQVGMALEQNGSWAQGLPTNGKVPQQIECCPDFIPVLIQVLRQLDVGCFGSTAQSSGVKSWPH